MTDQTTATVILSRAKDPSVWRKTVPSPAVFVRLTMTEGVGKVPDFKIPRLEIGLLSPTRLHDCLPHDRHIPAAFNFG
jgi:hypothetical protein